MKVLLISEDDEELNELRLLLHDLPSVDFVVVDQAYYLNPPPGLDAILLTLPAAERWSPDFKSRKAQILATSEEDQKAGFPSLIVTGVNLAPEDPKDLPSQLRILLERALEAVKENNKKAERRIGSLGVWAMDLTRCATTKQASEMLHQLLITSSEAD